MGMNLTQKVLGEHLVEGRLVPGEEISIRIDQTLLQDATGTLAMLEFEALGVERVKVDLAAQYVDHNLLQTDFKNADDHRYLQSACARYGVYFSRPGNGISHHVHMERFGAPGKTLLGADSHTASAAGVAMLAIGAGGLDVALAMAGEPYSFPCPKVLGVRLTGSLPDWVTARDVILELLRRRDVRGCIGMVIEFFGPGVKSLSAGDRKDIGNMGAELGATSSIFPSDENTRAYLKAEGRGEDWVELSADPDAGYDETDEIDLSSLEPLIACPSSPGNVVPVSEVAGKRVHQVIVGSSANGSFRDLMVVAEIFRGRTAHPDTALHINPASREVLVNVEAKGGVMLLLKAGASIHQSGCLGCIGMGQAPGTGEVSLRTFPRNFPGRSGTKGDQVYLCSSETAAAAALAGSITDPRDLGKEMVYPRVEDPEEYIVDTSSIISPPADGGSVEVVRGPNIRPFPELAPLPERLETEVLLKTEDNVTTDHIMPAGNQVLPLRSNIEAISEYVYYEVEPEFASRAKEKGAVAVVGGENYGQGSSREHAALAPRYLGVRAKVVKSYARIHKANLCNFGILPFTFKDPADYEGIEAGAHLVFPDVRRHVEEGDTELPVLVDGREISLLLEVSPRQRKMLLAGGEVNVVRERAGRR
jgi:aconitate hydratase